MRFRVWCSLALGLISTALWGCAPGDSGLPPEPILQPVRGKVTAQGQPLTHAVVTFLQTDEKGTTAVGETDEDGEYILSYAGRPGAAAADYKVAVSYIQGTDGKVYGLEPRSALAKPYGFLSAKELLVPEWSDLGRTTRTARIDVGGGVFDFDVEEPMLAPPEPPAAPENEKEPGDSAERPAPPKEDQKPGASPAPE